MVWTPSHMFPEVSSTQRQNLLLSAGLMSSRTPRIRRAGHNCCTNTFITSLGMPSMNFLVRKNNLLLDFPAAVLSSSQMKMEAENYHPLRNGFKTSAYFFQMDPFDFFVWSKTNPFYQQSVLTPTPSPSPLLQSILSQTTCKQYVSSLGHGPRMLSQGPGINCHLTATQTSFFNTICQTFLTCWCKPFSTPRLVIKHRKILTNLGTQEH